ncbi:hypothetical protein M3Y99_01100200 [Aphelenchoides fujianensis]|nr:hypothetical protein M3Y99_01100200 [Aphelenchoides fujianensis]
MLHEKPVLVAFAVSQRSAANGAKATLPLISGVRRTISPAAASTSSSDSAIGTTSPSSASSVSPAAHDHHNAALLHVAFAIQPDDPAQNAEVVEVHVGDLDADIAEIARRIGPQALLISTTEDLRQVLHPLAALHATRHFNVGETMDSTLRQRLPPVFSQFVSVDTLPDSRFGADAFAQMNTADRCRAVLEVLNEKNLDLLNHVETINEGYTPYVNFDRRIDSSLVVRTRGLPWQASDEDIALFFAGLNIAPGGIALCLGNEGRRNGESLVCFESNAHRELALRRHRNFLHNRYIEVYRSTGEEFLRVAVGSDSEALRFVCRDAAMIVRMRGLPFDCTENDIQRPAASVPAPNPAANLGAQMVGFPNAAAPRRPTGRRRSRRLPGSSSYEAKPEQIAEFLGPHAKQIVDQGIHMIFNNQGTPSGEAFIQMKSEVSASLAAMNTHNKNMEIGKKKRQCSLDEMSGVLNPLGGAALSNQLGLPLGLNTAQLLQLANAGLLPPQLGLASHLAAFRGVCPTSVYGQPALSQANSPHLPLPTPLGFPNASGVPTSGAQLNFLAAGMQNFGALANGAHVPPFHAFGNDAQLYAAAANSPLQQQQMMLEASGMYPQMPVLPPGFDLATAAAVLQQQAALVPTGSQR